MALRFTRRGEIRIGPDIAITRHLMRSAFLAEFAGRSRPKEGRTDRESYAITPVEADGVWIYATLGFRRETLLEVSIGLSQLPPEQWTWDHWSLEGEAASKRYLEQALVASLGSPLMGRVQTGALPQELLNYSLEYLFPWGKIDVYYDAKAAGTMLQVEYWQLWSRLLFRLNGPN